MRDPGFIRGIAERLRGLSGSVAAILIHSGGDPDSIGSAYVLSGILSREFGLRRVLFRIPSEVSTHSALLLEELRFAESGEDLEEAHYFIVLDCGSPEQLDGLAWVLDSGRPVVVIDHHSTSPESFGGKAEVHASEEYQSVCEIVLDLAEYLGYGLSAREAEALFLGIYYDTVRLSVADSETFKKVCRLVGYGVDPRDVIQKLETGMDPSERIARLKAAARLRIYRAGNWLIAASKLSSFQSSAARGLTGLGAHLSIVAGESGEGVVVSLRATRDFVEATGINVGRDIAARIGAEFEGHGGGHSSAARALCAKGEPEEILNRCVELVRELLGAPVSELKP